MHYLLWLIASLFLAGRAMAISVTPIVVDLEVAGTNSSATITVTNPNVESLPVEVLVELIAIDETGTTVSTTDALDDFIILPPQTTIDPGGTQTFRIQYIGDPDIGQGQLYRFAVNQVPVDTPQEGAAQIQIVYSITGLLTLSPLEADTAVRVAGTALVQDEEGANRASVTLHNDGNQHAYLSRGALTVRQLDAAGETLWRESLGAQRIEREIGFGIIPPGQARTFILPYDLPGSEGTISAEFDEGRQR
ncbi:fimbria/pilus periplasmic chaperone [Parasphingopyxis sp.]|uniref:fimbrial biogenesis chaperone n=1 Tax=Parasphingopyxis sp. TaxID=1920299 RepID=UPI00260170C3|nr:fimbria/pilus periplasmic chaperone [Parasphingopyxis sp.]